MVLYQKHTSSFCGELFKYVLVFFYLQMVSNILCMYIVGLDQSGLKESLSTKNNCDDICLFY